MIMNESIKLNSSSNFQIIDITTDISQILNQINKDNHNKIDNGIVNIFTKHSTSAILVNENEKGLLTDFEKVLKDLVKEKNNYKHDFMDNNAASHIRAFLLKSSETIPIVEGRLDLGTWQSIFFIELDGPRTNRTIDLTFIGE
ncbi:secondary thiamine-phosphate synthase enzyme YjbQ [Methanobrevibacter olleyae]|uniref:Secondary thiamine-phosphate synthase enzyme n=1 Tax=Methanobrevibacter olleyae TaxID=294671 RepID=A0A126R010_METOL|nr:secondary thiamine-phosphate synthase enzyme YjbQ [Methanobrevibacter olleyae]AMK15631.1 secondary thiamine-phosphate synthase enzyme [Methanobrevibacter olleyae]SFL24368.1 secondary thiamine-phosphate synthase enzyme [Methanobrevibacter olleyae]